jgi:hypothetical protein
VLGVKDPICTHVHVATICIDRLRCLFTEQASYVDPMLPIWCVALPIDVGPVESSMVRRDAA